MPPKRKQRAEESEAAPAKKQHGGGDRGQGRKKKAVNTPGEDDRALPPKRQMGLGELLGQRFKPAPKASEQEAAIDVDAASPTPAAGSSSSAAPPAAAAAASASRPAQAAASRAQPFKDSIELGPAWHTLSGYGDEQLDEEHVERILKANLDFVKRVLVSNEDLFFGPAKELPSGSVCADDARSVSSSE